jgi:hypothetical protein
LIPDLIDGSEADNDALIADSDLKPRFGCPIWHLHESLNKLERLVWNWPRVALGSSGEFAEIGTFRWWSRMAEAMTVCCDREGFPLTRLHGLRMLDPQIVRSFPFASADSTNVARNIGLDQRWTGSYTPINEAGRAVVIADRIEAVNSPHRWVRFETQQTLFGETVIPLSVDSNEIVTSTCKKGKTCRVE